MGYKSYIGKKAKCPLFTNVIKTTNGQFIGIECEPLNVNLGFAVAPVIRIDTSAELKDFTDLFCNDLYEECPYYKIHANWEG